MNLRPPGPQPGALPDCATPRGARRFYGYAQMGPCDLVRTYVRDDRTQKTTAVLRRCGSSLAAVGLRLAANGPGAAGQLLPACRAAYGKEHYASQPRALHRASPGAPEASSIAERTAVPHRLLPRAPLRDCGETDPLVLSSTTSATRSSTSAQGPRGPQLAAILDEIATSATSFVRTVIGAAPPGVTRPCSPRPSANRPRSPTRRYPWPARAVAQLVEHQPSKLMVAGSIPVSRFGRTLLPCLRRHARPRSSTIVSRGHGPNQLSQRAVERDVEPLRSWPSGEQSIATSQAYSSMRPERCSGTVARAPARTISGYLRSDSVSKRPIAAATTAMPAGAQRCRPLARQRLDRRARRARCAPAPGSRGAG